MNITGAAYAAGLAVKAWNSLDELLRIVGKAQQPQTFTPNKPKSKIDKMLTQWHKAVKASFGWLPGVDSATIQIQDETTREKAEAGQLLTAIGGFLLGAVLVFVGLRRK